MTLDEVIDQLTMIRDWHGGKIPVLHLVEGDKFLLDGIECVSERREDDVGYYQSHVMIDGRSRILDGKGGIFRVRDDGWDSRSIITSSEP